MLKAKLLTTLALIGCINFYFDDPEVDLAKTRVQPSVCALDGATAGIQTAPADTYALGAQDASCADRKASRDPAVI